MIPTLMAFFMAMVAASPVFWLETKGLSRTMAILAVVAGFSGVLFAIGVLVGSSLQDPTTRGPE